MFENKFKKYQRKKLCKKNLAYFAFSCWLSVYKHESVLLDLLVTVSEFCQYLRISTISSRFGCFYETSGVMDHLIRGQKCLIRVARPCVFLSAKTLELNKLWNCYFLAFFGVSRNLFDRKTLRCWDYTENSIWNPIALQTKSKIYNTT